jgi:hypothetical protein
MCCRPDPAAVQLLYEALPHQCHNCGLRFGEQVCISMCCFVVDCVCVYVCMCLYVDALVFACVYVRMDVYGRM